MEKVVNQYEKEYMKMAILKHEETFKEQVYELHRLYQTQKILMKNIENNMSTPNHRWNNASSKHATSTTTTTQMMKKPRRKLLDLEQPAEDYVEDLEGGGCGGAADIEVKEVEDEKEIELTLGPTSYNNRRRKQQQQQRHTTPLTSDSEHYSFSSSSSGSSSHIKKMIINKEHLTAAACGRWGGRNNGGFKVEDEEQQQQQQRLKQPPWILQAALSLNT